MLFCLFYLLFQTDFTYCTIIDVTYCSDLTFELYNHLVYRFVCYRSSDYGNSQKIKYNSKKRKLGEGLLHIFPL